MSQTLTQPNPRSLDSQPQTRDLRLAIPKGRMQQQVVELLQDAGVRIISTVRDYRPAVSLDGCEAKLLKPQAIVEMLDQGARDLGFAGADWIGERQADVVELLDTGLDPVRIVAAAPIELLVDGRLPDRPLVVASEYVNLARDWAQRFGLADARILRSFGATEALPPEDADVIIDNVATGSTLKANNLAVIDEVSRSSTRLYASRAAISDPDLAQRIESLTTLLASVLAARQRRLVEFNIQTADLDRAVSTLPAMREPTISSLRDAGWCAVKIAVERDQLAEILPQIKSAGGCDIIVTAPSQIIP